MKLPITSLIALLLCGCMDSGSSRRSDYRQTGTNVVPSAVGADQAVSDPSSNSLNRSGTVDQDGGTWTARQQTPR